MIIPWWLIIVVYGLLGLGALAMGLKLFVKRNSRCKGCGMTSLIGIKQMGADHLEHVVQIMEDLGLPATFEAKIYVCRDCKTVHDQFFQPERIPRCRDCRQLTQFISDGRYQCLSCAKSYALRPVGDAGYKRFEEIR